ncbi:DNA-directed RNA polymerase III subunit C1 (rpo31) [Elasticomyces elasticus]|nr:DNA-directed RNA polymerase III subunit C1 (rpo31) [Elasticomyces elasticus]
MNGRPPPREVKEQVLHHAPKRIKELQFGVLSPQEIVDQAVVEVCDRNVFDMPATAGGKRQHTEHGPMDERMGVSTKNGTCRTCNEPLRDCNGHFGTIKLALPCFHIGYLKKVIDMLQCICKDCSRVLLKEDARQSFLTSLRRPGMDNLQKEAICRRILAECKKCKVCLYCGATNGAVRKVAGHPLKVIHIKYFHYHQSHAKSKVKPDSMVEWEKSFEEAKKGNNDLERHLRKAVDDMNPLRALNLFRRMSGPDVELLGIRPERARPEMFIWQYIPVPPVCIRPSVEQEGATTEDDITNKIGDIVYISGLLKAGLEKGQPINVLMEQWEFLQVQVAMYIDGNLPGLRNGEYGKQMRGFNQRLKGKQGRFRGNLSGKRVDFSARTVISPDPNLSIDEVAVPKRIAMNMTYPEKVSVYNVEKLQGRVKNGKLIWPGANTVIKADGRKFMLQFMKNLGSVASQLRVGDTVERHLEDGDIVLFNRQPSLHKLSILSHKAKIRPWRTFRLNECVCNPYNADFDGDEMNLHVPQTEEARAEAIELMGVKNNLATPKNGTPLIAAIQDFITCAYLSSSKDNFFDRKTFTQIVGYMFDADSVWDPATRTHMSIEIPPPAIIKPQSLWTGKQIWNVLMRPNSKSKVLINLNAACKQHRPPKGLPLDLDENDAYLVIRNSEVMCGVMDKATVGDGKKDSVFYVMMRDYGPDYAVQAMNRLAKLSARWLTNQGFSIGINDVYPSQNLVDQKEALIQKAYADCKELINRFKNHDLDRDAGCDAEATMENRISGILSRVRAAAGDICFAELSRHNAALIMAKCGSKGSNINVSQMVAAVGQQIIGGKRVLDGFQDRTLPHFPKAGREPAAKGFVKNSFFSGLDPTEFIFHAMSGREGLVDTAVKTAETGYMSRRLMKSLEDLSTQYDHTVRNSSSGVVQFQYGDDKLDPVDMEGNAKPVNFERTFIHAVSTTWDNEERGLRPSEVSQITRKKLDPERSKLTRFSLTGEQLAYTDKSDHGIDQSESARDFLDTVENFIEAKAERLANVREKVAMSPGREEAMFVDSEVVDDGIMPSLLLERQPHLNVLTVRQRGIADGILKISERALTEFIDLCLTKYERSKVQPGHAVGAVGAQSIGEPGTQMTLKTFHFAGVAGMSITQGVPRIKEIINASKVISTPVISCALEAEYSDVAGQMAKALVEKTYLRDIIYWIEDVWHSQGCYLNMRVDWTTINKLQLRLTLYDIEQAIMRTKGLRALGGHVRTFGRSHLRVYMGEADNPKARRAPKAPTSETLFVAVQNLKRTLPSIIVTGYPDAQRAIIKKDDRPNAQGREEVSLLVEGYGLKACMTTAGILGVRTRTNSVMETREVLGIEAARATVVAEISSVMAGMDIDPRHMQLLADVMTYSSDVLGITRFGLAKMRSSVLQLASFEKTPDHLFDAAAGLKRDRIEGVSECIIMGQSIRIGTGCMKVVRRLGIEGGEGRRDEGGFEVAFGEGKGKAVGKGKAKGKGKVQRRVMEL